MTQAKPKKTKNSHERIKVAPLFQIACTLISALIFGGIMQYRIGLFRSTESSPEISTITPKKHSEFGSFPGDVHVGLYIDQFKNFNMVNNEFNFGGTIWFEFNPGVISLSTLEKFSFESGRITYISPPDTQLLNKKLIVRYNIEVEFHSALDYKNFPLDAHRLYILLSHKFVSPSEVSFSTSEHDFQVKTDAITQQAGWRKVGKDVKNGYIKAEFDPYNTKKTRYYPVTLFSIDYLRYGIRYAISIFLPLLLLFYLTLFTLSISPNRAINIATAGTTATLAYRFVIERISPTIGYFMISDYMFFLFLAINFFIFFINIFDIFSRQLSESEKKIIVVTCHLIINSVATYLFLKANV